MVLEYLNKENIVVNAEAESWEDAVKIAGEVLLEKDCIEERYIQKMIDIVKEIGPYIVIDKGLALAHARPEDGAKKLGLSLVTLKNPIEFGSEDNDPVKIVIGLSATEADTHVDLLSNLMILLADEESMSKIADSCSESEIENIIKDVYS